ncbi:MAG: tyrosine decarboxylase MfnA [Euryarchaeota archaeon]|nr:tyrosine decarboxylase MfnA [Euryarchaeota archaeon]
MQEKAWSREELEKALQEAKRRDMSYSSGRILSSMCTAPHQAGVEAFLRFLDTNLGDPGLFPGTRELERRAVAEIASLLGSGSARGFIVSGGTEANITALWVARELSGVTKPEVVLPETAHFSFEKAARMLRLRLVYAGVHGDSSVDVDEVRRRLSERTVAVVGIAGNTEYGGVDDIEALSELASEQGIYLHVDAAFGGFVLPFLRELGYRVRRFDFSLPGVCSITVDPHKMGLAPVPAGCILFRNEEFLESLQVESPYLSMPVQCTLLGTRSGASAAAVFAVLKSMGREGYRRVVEECMRNTLLLREELLRLGFRVREPWMNILVFEHPEVDAVVELRRRGWAVSRTRAGEARVVLMPHVKREHVEELVEVLREIAP